MQRVAKAAAGIDQRRAVPRSPPSRCVAGPRGVARLSPATTPDVVLWADSFTDGFASDSGRAAVDGAGGGGPARRRGRRARLLRPDLDQHRPARRPPAGSWRAPSTCCTRTSRAGIPVVGLEPSCLATLRSDAVELTDDPRAAEVAGRRALARRAAGRRCPDWTPPDLTGTTVVVQPHCHHASVVGWEADAALLARTGATVTRVGGCCGLAGNFGVEQGHYEVSVAVAEHDLLPGGARPRGRTRWCSPTGSPAAPSSTTSPGCGRCTSPSCSAGAGGDRGRWSSTGRPGCQARSRRLGVP